MSKTQQIEEDRILVAKDSFAASFEGTDHQFSAGKTFVREGHPILKGIEHLFEPLRAHYEIERGGE